MLVKLERKKLELYLSVSEALEISGESCLVIRRLTGVASSSTSASAPSSNSALIAATNASFETLDPTGAPSTIEGLASISTTGDTVFLLLRGFLATVSSSAITMISSGSTVAVAFFVLPPRAFLAGGSTSSGSAVAVFLGLPLPRLAGTSVTEAVSDPFSETMVTPLLDALTLGADRSF
jgi:hypothetical protein